MSLEAPPTLADGPLPKESRPLLASVSPACFTLDNGQAALGWMTFYEFFAGAGLVRLGLGPNWTCLLANDNDVDKATSYARNFSVQDLKIDDVACLTAADLPGHADLAWSSFPCQDLSLAGGRAGLEGSRSATFWDFWDLMMALRAEGRAPRLVVIENVCGLITGHGGKDFVALCRRLHGRRLSRRRHGDRRRAVRAAIAPARFHYWRRCGTTGSRLDRHGSARSAVS